jgi:2-haloacid dehalogenase
VAEIRVLACDVFGTTVDWYTGVTTQLSEVFTELGLSVDAGAFANEWRAEYVPSMQRVRDGQRGWANLDVLHAESLDLLLDRHGLAGAVDPLSRARMVRAWHRLPAWSDTVAGLARLRTRYVTATLSNGGFALLTNLVKAEALPFDCVISAEMVRAYKPDPRVYRAAADLLDVAPAEVLMVAAHGGDLAAAAAVGLRTAFLERPREHGPYPGADRAADVTSDITVTSFPELADRLGC